MGVFWDSSFRTRFLHLLLFLSPILVSADPVPARAPGPSYSPSRLPQSYSSIYTPAASPTSCPSMNGSIITGTSGYHYQILCNYALTAYDGYIGQKNDFTDVSQCAAYCDQFENCTAATYGGVSKGLIGMPMDDLLMDWVGLVLPQGSSHLHSAKCCRHDW